MKRPIPDPVADPSSHLFACAVNDQAGMAHHSSSSCHGLKRDELNSSVSLGKPYQDFETEGCISRCEAFCRYWLPARFDDVFDNNNFHRRSGGASVRFHYRITRQSDNAWIAEGYTSHACVDDREGQTILSK
jgi:hypothetical protein